MFETQARELGFESARAFLEYGWPDPGEEARALRQMPGSLTWDPPRTNRTTPREMSRLLSLIWRDEAGPADACAAVRRLMGLQLQRERIARGFPQEGTRFSGKTGSYGPFQNEAGSRHVPGRDALRRLGVHTLGDGVPGSARRERRDRRRGSPRSRLTGALSRAFIAPKEVVPSPSGFEGRYQWGAGP